MNYANWNELWNILVMLTFYALILTDFFCTSTIYIVKCQNNVFIGCNHFFIKYRVNFSIYSTCTYLQSIYNLYTVCMYILISFEQIHDGQVLRLNFKHIVPLVRCDWWQVFVPFYHVILGLLTEYSTIIRPKPPSIWLAFLTNILITNQFNYFQWPVPTERPLNLWLNRTSRMIQVETSKGSSFLPARYARLKLM